MILRKCTLVICLLAVFAAPLHPQPKSQSAGPVKKHVCPQGFCVVDLCALAAQLDPVGPIKVVTMEFEAPRGRTHQLRDHDGIQLSYNKKEQIIWTCKDKGFQITQIRKVWNGCEDNDPDMPFNLNQTEYAKLREPQSPGTQLHSGPLVAGAIGHTYKFSFIIAGGKKSPPRQEGDPTSDLMVGKLYDPHIIVTSGDPPGPENKAGPKPCISPGPHPTPSPHKGEKSSLQKGGTGGF